MAFPERPLSLHISALSPEEYNAFTTVLAELAGPSQDGNEWDRPVDTSETRGWIRGRYGLDASVLDKILRYFPYTRDRNETLSAGQFFAVMRLVTHAQAGRDPVKTLVFVQSNPTSDSRPMSPPPRKNSIPQAKFGTPSKSTPAPPTPNRPRGPSDAQNISPDPSSTLPPPSPNFNPRNPNPFRRSASVSGTASSPIPGFSSSLITQAENEDNSSEPPPLPVPPLHPYTRSVQASSPAETASANTVKPSSSTLQAKNPFAPDDASSRSAMSPPLPPRKPPALPPRGDSLLASSVAPAPPRLPPKPSSSKSLATSSLMKESLKAARTGQAQKANETLLERTLNWEVIGRSASRDPSSSPSGASILLPQGRQPSPTRPRRSPPSPPGSTSSLEVIAAARLPSAMNGASNRLQVSPIPFSSASSSSSSGKASEPVARRKRIVDEPTMDEDAPISPESRRVVGRSKSLHHHPSAGHAPLPPPPRRRPESIQVLKPSSTGYGGLYGGLAQQPFTPAINPNHTSSGDLLGRRVSIQSSRSAGATLQSTTPRDGPPPGEAFQQLFDSVRKKAEVFQPRIEDGFESVRRKAEGRVVPGGFTRRGAEGRSLVQNGRDEEGERLTSAQRSDDEGGDASTPGADVDWSEWDTRKGGGGSNVSGGGSSVDHEPPLGDGWRRL